MNSLIQLAFLVLVQQSPSENIELLTGQLRSGGQPLGQISVELNPSIPLSLNFKRAHVTDKPALQVKWKGSMIAREWIDLIVVGVEIQPKNLTTGDLHMDIRFKLLDGRIVFLELQEASVASRLLNTAQARLLPEDGKALAGPQKNILPIPFAAHVDRVRNHPDWNRITQNCENGIGQVPESWDVNPIGE